MLSEGATAPSVVLPGYVDGERERVDLGASLGDGIVVLVFYPADFNPGCSMQSSDLGDLDLFTMQKDVSVFAVSPDSTYSHEAFAERYSLRVPLLSDVDGDAASAYDVELETETGEHLCQRAVFVVDHRGEVVYAWATDDLEERVNVDPVKQAVGDIGGDETALERYRLGVERYAEGREAFTAAMADYQDREWIPARGAFEEAEPAFAAAADHLNTAVRFAETAAFETVADRAEEKADTLQHAADWLGQSADELAQGRGKSGTEYRDDAEQVIDAASDLPEPPEADAFTLTDDGIESDDSVVVDPEESERAFTLEDDAVAVDTNLAVDDDALDAAVAADSSDEPTEGDAVEGDLEMDLDAVEAEDRDRYGGGDDGDRYGKAGQTTDAGDTTDGVTRGGSGARDSRSGGVDGASGGANEGDAGGERAASGERPESGERTGDEAGDDGDEPVEQLDLADPTEGEEGEADDERADWDIPGQ